VAKVSANAVSCNDLQTANVSHVATQRIKLIADRTYRTWANSAKPSLYINTKW